jgi:hypothetical protein
LDSAATARMELVPVRAMLSAAGELLVLDRSRGWIQIANGGLPATVSGLVPKEDFTRAFDDGWVDSRGTRYAFDSEHSTLIIDRVNTFPASSQKLPLAATDLHGDARTLFAAVYPRQFSLDRSERKRIVPLIAKIDLASLRVLGTFGSPRDYNGQVIPVIGNAVLVRYDEHRQRLWVAWPLEPVIRSYDSAGILLTELRRPLPFKPNEPVETKLSRRELLPRAKVERITYDVALNSNGDLLVLGPTGHPQRDSTKGALVKRAALAIDVIESHGSVRCRVPISEFGSAISAVAEHAILVTGENGQLTRITYSCPPTQ